MALTDYFPADRLDSPATEEDIAHAEERLGTNFPADLRAFWLTSATFNGALRLADGSEGPYLRILHPASVVASQGILHFAKGEDWDYGVVPGSPARWVDIDRESGEVLSELGQSFSDVLEALRSEHADDVL